MRPGGVVAGGFFVAIFPRNVAQFMAGRDAFGPDSDAARAVRLVFEPVLVVWTLWSTQAWQAWQAAREAGRASGR